MNLETWGVLKARLETMDGFPAWSNQLSDDYFMDLEPIRQDISEQIARGVRRKFDKRPSVKALLDWAIELTPDEPFDIRRLSGPVPSDAPRLTGQGMERIGSGMPAHVKAKIEAIRNRHVEPNGTKQWGIQWRDTKTGTVTRTQPSYSRAAADAKADEHNRKWPHVVTTVFHKDESAPSKPQVRAAEQQAQESRELASV